MVTPICDGLFFTAPSPLPRGRHVLERADVIAAQRERLMIAACELLAATGYRSLGVREIAAHAKTSRQAFYQCFNDKDECIFAAYGRFIDLLVGRLVAVFSTSSTWESTLSAVIRAYLETLSADPVVARAFQVEMDALGRPGRDRRREALTGLAELLKTRRDQLWPGAERVDLAAYVGAVYAIRQLASDLLDEDAKPDLALLASQSGPWILGMLSIDNYAD